MSEERFTVMKKFDGSYVICEKGEMLVADDCCDLLNELNKDFEDCEKLLDSKDDFIHKFKRDIEELGISIKLFEDDIATKDKKIEEQQATIEHLTKSRDKWSKSAKLHSEYFNCLEKAIEIAYEEKPYPKIEDIMNIYSKLEKEIDDE